MNRKERSKAALLVRLALIPACVITVGYLLYSGNVFIPTMRPFQFVMSGITAGLAYAFFITRAYRTGIAALLVWYVIATGLLVDFNWWLPILDLGYIAGIGGTVRIYVEFRKHPVLPGPVLRTILAGTFFSLANGCIILFLSLFSPQIVLKDVERWASIVVGNMELGAVIGLAAGIGFELSDGLIDRFDR